MNRSFGTRLLLCLFRKHVYGLSCEMLCSSRSRLHVHIITSESRRDMAGFKSVETSEFRPTESRKEEQICVPRSQLFSFLQFVKYNNLSPQEQWIHTKHVEALERGDNTYEDPVTRYHVFTRLAHLRRGECCGSACRHCPCGHKAVPPDKPKKVYNSAFYV